MKLDPPVLFVHVRISTTGSILDVEAFRDALLTLCAQLTPDYALRVKRRTISRHKAEKLLEAYLVREAEGPVLISARQSPQQLQDSQEHDRDPQRRPARRRGHRDQQRQEGE